MEPSDTPLSARRYVRHCGCTLERYDDAPTFVLTLVCPQHEDDPVDAVREVRRDLSYWTNPPKVAVGTPVALSEQGV